MLYRKSLPSKEYLRERLEYNPETGLLFWKIKALKEGDIPSRVATWNTRYAGTQAFKKLDANGYLQGVIDDVSYQAQRIIYKWVTGEEPEEIDHDNRIRSDNRWSNLKASTHLKNNQNQGLRSNNKSGVTGVIWDKQADKWGVKIGNKRVGRYTHLADAIAAREDALRDHGYHPNHGKNNN